MTFRIEAERLINEFGTQIAATNPDRDDSGKQLSCSSLDQSIDQRLTLKAPERTLSENSLICWRTS